MDPSNVATDIASPTTTPESRASQKPPTATRSLPGIAYTDPVLYEQELTEVFERAWILVGHISELSEPGHYVTANVGREPVLVVRGHDGELRAMSNVCRHRASTILEGTGQTRSVMRCPYHAWTYELDGQLAAAPSGQGFACLDRDQVALPQFRVGVVGGLVFCCIDPEQMSLEEMLGPVGPYLEWLNVVRPAGAPRSRRRPVDRGLRGELEDPRRQLFRGLPRPGGPSDPGATGRRQGDHRRQQRLVRVVPGAVPHPAVPRPPRARVPEPAGAGCQGCPRSSRTPWATSASGRRRSSRSTRTTSTCGSWSPRGCSGRGRRP